MSDLATGPHIVGRESINSGSSVSDLSEAISDMSLSTSPGSDLPTSVSSNNMADRMSTNSRHNSSGGGVEEGPAPNPYPRKKRVMRQLSSNPYLASSEMSPDDQIHPVILGANSYAGEPPPDVFDDFYSNEDVSLAALRFRANSYPLASEFITNSDESEEEGRDRQDREETNNLPQAFLCNGNPDSNRNGHNRNYHSNGDHCGNFNHQSFTSDETSPSFHHNHNGLEGADFSPFHPNISSPQFKLEHEVGSFKRLEYDHHYTHHSNHYHHSHQTSPLPNSQTEILSNQLFTPPTPSPTTNSHHHYHHHQRFIPNPIPTSESCPPNPPHLNNVQLRREKERHQSESGVHPSSRHPDYQPQSREINSWGHFSKHTERHYKYRRSHCNSSDSDDESQRYYRNNKPLGIPSEKSQSHPHPVKKNNTSHSSSPTNDHKCHNDNAPPLPTDNNSSRVVLHSKNQNQVSANEKASDFNGVKPQVFKDRFQFMKRWFADCNDGQKNVVLKGLLKLCDLPQLHLLSVHMSRELHRGCPSNCEDILTWLPTNLATKVMTYLDPVSLCRAAQVCGVWRSLAEDQSLWRRFCCQTKWRLSKAAEHKQVISHMSAEGSIQWKNVFAERFRLRNNWLKGRRTVRTFEGHHQGISCVQFDDSRIVSGSSDKTIKVWNMRTNAPWSVQTLMGHHGTVRCLHLEGNRLVSGSCDTTIKVWDLSTEESWSSIACKVTMTGHSDTVRCLQADDDKVISGSYDKTLKIWDLKSGELRQTLRGHQGSVLCVHFSETKIVSGSVDKTIKVWNHEGSCMNTLCGHQDAVTCLMFDSTRIVSGSLDHNLKFWDVHSGECLNTIDWKMAEGHTGVVRCLQADSWRVVSAGDDKTIKVWNLATGERLVTLRDHTDGVTCLQFNDFIIVSGSYDKTVKLWDFSCC